MNLSVEPRWQVTVISKSRHEVKAVMVCHGMSWYVMVCHGMSWCLNHVQSVSQIPLKSLNHATGMGRQAGADYARLQRAAIVAVCAVGAKPGTAPCVYHHVPVKDIGHPHG